MKKTLALTLAGVITAAALLAGCSGNTGSSDSPAPQSSTPPASQAQTGEQTGTEKQSLVVVTGGGTYNPYSYTDEETDELKGFEADMWAELSVRLSDKYDVTVESTTFDAIWGNLDAQRADVAACFFGVNDERLEKYSASITYASDPLVVAVPAGSEIKTLADLNGKTVGVAAGSAALDEMESRKAELGCEVRTYEAFTEVIQDVALGRIDACANDAIAIVSYNTTDTELVNLEETLTDSSVAYFTRQDEASQAKLADINAALQTMLDDGTVAELCQTWFGADLTVNIKQ